MKWFKDIDARGRVLYITYAALEYFVALMSGGAYIAMVTETLGISDSLTGIITSFVSLGCSFQVFAIFLTRKKRVKPFVVTFGLINQACFGLVYIVPFFNIPGTAKTVIYMAAILIANALLNVGRAPNTKWFYSYVDDKHRGVFTATNEMVSLIGGTAFSFVIGLVIDKFEAAGNVEGAFLFCGIGIFGLTVIQSLCFLFSKEKTYAEAPEENVGQVLKALVNNKRFVKVVILQVLWAVTVYSTTPFYGTYMRKELGFSMTFISIVSIVGALTRAAISRPMGRYGDRNSFMKMMNLCLCVFLCAYVFKVFTVPANGHVFVIIYTAIYAIGSAGINSTKINLVFECVEPEHVMPALGVQNAFSGIAGFLTTLAISPLVSYIQDNGNRFLGMNVYAQQVVSFIGMILVGATLVYANFGLHKGGKNDETDAESKDVNEAQTA